MSAAALKAALEGKLKILERELKIELPQEIKRAVALGDLKENAEYHAAKERQRFLEGLIGHLKQQLSEMSLIRFDQIPEDRIGLGSLFKAIDLHDDKEVRFEIVMEGLSDPAKGLISVSSPLARGFLNKKVGDQVTIIIPSGKKSYEITDLTTVHKRG